MTERAVHLVDHVIPDVPVRQGLLALPHPSAVGVPSVRVAQSWGSRRPPRMVSRRWQLGPVLGRLCCAIESVPPGQGPFVPAPQPGTVLTYYRP